jgi:dTDP-4-amino-4,6-dideoxygalactose transaminase
MIAPVLHAGLKPKFYALGDDALPRLDSLGEGKADGVHAIIVAHYFGLPRSLADVRRWCDSHRVALIEDCAHSFFGCAGDRPVGAWGDFATASLTKFFPVAEAGLLVSAKHVCPELKMGAQGWKAQIKGIVDVLEAATQAGRLQGLQLPLRGLFWLKNRRGDERATLRAPIAARGLVPFDELQGCDMSRAGMSPVAMARWAYMRLPRSRIAARRRANFEHLKRELSSAPGARVLFDQAPTDAPYALPLWVEDADRVYQGLRLAGMPVFRWDRVWANTPTLAQDNGASWSRHVLQLLCHQDLGDAEAEVIAATVRRLL